MVPAVEIDQDPKPKYLSVRVSPELYSQFKEVATANHRKIEWELRRMVQSRVEEFEAVLRRAA